MWQVRPSTIGALSAAALLALGACSGDGTAPRALVLSQAQADSLGEQLTLDAEDEIAGAAASGAASFSAVAAPVLSPSSSATVQCTPTRTPASPTDADGDGVPDSVRLDFAGCVF